MAESTRDLAAAASAGMYRSLFEGSPHPTLIVDRGSLHVLRANAAAVTRYGYSLSELVNLRLSTLWPGAEQVLSQGQGTSNVQRLVHRNGDEREASVDLQESSSRASRQSHCTSPTGASSASRPPFSKRTAACSKQWRAAARPLAVVLEELARQMAQLADSFAAPPGRQARLTRWTTPAAARSALRERACSHEHQTSNGPGDLQHQEKE